MKWQKVKLGEVADSCLGKMLDQNKNRGDYHPYLANVNVRWGEFDLQELPKMRFLDSEKERYGLKYGDLVICEGGEPGRCALWKEQLPDMRIQKALHRVRVHDNVDSQYLYYWFLHAGKEGRLEQYVTGATIKHMPGDKLKSVIIDLPPLPVQRRIASVLSAYDDLIENNQKQLKLLEEAARRIYREWFVALRFPGHEKTPIVDGMPRGWRKNRAETFFEITIGKTPPRAEKQWFSTGKESIPWLSISDMGNGGIYIFTTSEGVTEEAVKKHAMKVVPLGTILVSFKLTVGRVAIASKAMCSNEAIAHFCTNDDALRAYAFFYLQNFEYATLGNTSSISQAVNSKIIKGMPFIAPDKKTLSCFSQLVKPLLDEIHNRQATCLKLQESRDRLLPKLLNGELELAAR